MNFNRQYRFLFTPRQVAAALLCTCLVIAADLKFRFFSGMIFVAQPAKTETPAGSIVVNGFDNLPKHRIFDRPDSPFDKRIVMLGACQISSLHWDYTPEGFDTSGRSSLPYLLDKEFHKTPWTENLHVYNLGMEGTGYIEAFYFLLSVLEQPNIRLVIFSISQEGDNHIPNENPQRFGAYSRFLPRMETMMKSYIDQYPDIPELREYYDYVRRNPWTIAGREMETSELGTEAAVKRIESDDPVKGFANRMISFLEYNLATQRLRTNHRWISANTSALLVGFKEWLGILSARTYSAGNEKPEEWYLSRFKPRPFPYTARTKARYRKLDQTALRAMAKLLAKKKIDLWVHNPADLAVRMNSIVNDGWWVPLTKSLSDLANVKTIDMSALPIENGIDTGGRVAPTYYGSLKTMKAFIPYIMEWNRND